MNNLFENLNEKFIEELKSKNNIVDVVGRYCKLQRNGSSNYWACCPLPGHTDKTLSFMVNEPGQFYHCFGCGKGGDVINFIEEVENLDFYGAIKFLAENAKISMPENNNSSDEYSKKLKEKKDIFEDSNKKLIKLIYEKLNEVNASNGERERATRELELIKKNNDSRVFLFYYDLIEFMKKENIYFLARGIYYTSLYCSYLLGFLDYNPMLYNLSTLAYEEGSKAFEFEVLRDRYDDVVKYLFDTYGERLYKTTTNTKSLHIYHGKYLLTNSNLTSIEKLEVDGETAVKLPPNTWRNNEYFIFCIYSFKTLNKLYNAETSSCKIIDYEDFNDIKVYEYLEKSKLAKVYFSLEEIAKRKPTSIIELAQCTYKNCIVTERNLPHYINYAILYYKLAKLKIMGLIDSSIEFVDCN